MNPTTSSVPKAVCSRYSISSQKRKFLVTKGHNDQKFFNSNLVASVLTHLVNVSECYQQCHISHQEGPRLAALGNQTFWYKIRPGGFCASSRPQQGWVPHLKTPPLSAQTILVFFWHVRTITVNFFILEKGSSYKMYYYYY